MFNINKLFLLISAILLVIVLVETGYFVYLDRFSPVFYSLSSVTQKKDYEVWLKRNSAVTRSRLVNPDDNTHLIINQTDGILRDFLVKDDKVLTTIQTKKGAVYFTFLNKEFKTYKKPANTKEVLIPINSETLKTGDNVIIHESYIVIDDKIKNTSNGIVKME